MFHWEPELKCWHRLDKWVFCDQSGAGDDRLQYSCQQLDYGSFVVFTILIYLTFKDAKWLYGKSC